MSPTYQITACPLCRAEFDDPDDYRSHLADEHGLVDDDGTETVLPTAAPDLPVLDAPPELDVLEPLPSPPPPPGVPPAAPPALTAGAVARKAPTPLVALAIVAVVQLFLGLVALAVVGGDDAEDARSSVIVEGTPEASRPADGPAAALADPAADQRRADAIAPRPSDLPAGWTLDPDSGSDEEGGGEVFDREFDKCAAGLDETDQSIPTKEVSLSGGDSGVFAVVGVEKTTEAAVKSMDLLRGLTPCFGEAMATGIRAETPRGITVRAGRFEPVAAGRYGDDSEAQSMAITIAGPGGQAAMRVDVFAIRKDRAIVWIMAAVLNDELTTAQERSMLGAVASRM